MIKRALRHLFTLQASARRAFPADTLKAMQAAIAKGEASHRAELRVIIEPALGMAEAFSGQTARQRARELFARYGVWDTEENTGILLYINLADRQVEIIADRGVARLLEAVQWQQVCRTMTAAFASNRYHEGVLEGIGQLNRLLQERLPGGTDGSPNELSNKPLLL